jgi:hypothetical protein
MIKPGLLTVSLLAVMIARTARAETRVYEVRERVEYDEPEGRFDFGFEGEGRPCWLRRAP